MGRFGSNLTALHLIVVAFSLACADAVPAVRTAVRDSAGIQIVENTVPDETRLPLLVMGPPDYTIGTVDGPSEYTLFGVQGATRLSDGRVVILDRSAQLRFYDRAGLFQHAVGSKGEGPGEFDGPTHLRRLTGDTLLVADRVIRRPRTYYFDSSGVFVRDVQYEREILVRGQLQDSAIAVRFIPIRDDALLLIAQRGIYPGQPPPTRPFYPLFVVPSQRRIWALGNYPMLNLGLEVAARLRGFVVVPFPFAVVAHDTTMSPDDRAPNIYLGDLGVHGYRVYDHDGSLTRIVTTDSEPITVDPGLPGRIRELLYQQVVQSGGDSIRFDRNYFALGQFESVYPAFIGIAAASTGHVWLTRYPVAPNEQWEDRSDTVTRFDVYDPLGALLGTIEFGGPNQPLEIGADYVLMLRRDANDVEFVDVYLNRTLIPLAR